MFRQSNLQPSVLVNVDHRIGARAAPCDWFLSYLLFFIIKSGLQPHLHPAPPPPLPPTAHMSACKYERAAFQSVGWDWVGVAATQKCSIQFPNLILALREVIFFFTPLSLSHTHTHARVCVGGFLPMFFFCPQGRGYTVMLHTHFFFMPVCHPWPSWRRFRASPRSLTLNTRRVAEAAPRVLSCAEAPLNAVYECIVNSWELLVHASIITVHPLTHDPTHDGWS